MEDEQSNLADKSNLTTLSLDCHLHILEYLFDDVFSIGKLMLCNAEMENKSRSVFKNLKLKLVTEADFEAEAYSIINFFDPQMFTQGDVGKGLYMQYAQHLHIIVDSFVNFTNLQILSAIMQINLDLLFKLPNLRKLKAWSIVYPHENHEFIGGFQILLNETKNRNPNSEAITHIQQAMEIITTEQPVLHKLQSLTLHIPVTKYFWDYCPNLESFNLKSKHGNLMFDNQVIQIKNLRNLRKLKISGAMVNVSNESLANIVSLSVVSIQSDCINYVPKLEKLFIHDPTVVFLEKLCETHSASLKHLGIKYTNFNMNIDLGFCSEFFGRFPNLTSLRFDCVSYRTNNIIGRFSFGPISTLPLEELHLNCVIDFADHETLLGLRKLRKCTFYQMSDNNVHQYLSQLELDSFKFKMFYGEWHELIPYVTVPNLVIHDKQYAKTAPYYRTKVLSQRRNIVVKEKVYPTVDFSVSQRDTDFADFLEALEEIHPAIKSQQIVPYRLTDRFVRNLEINGVNLSPFLEDQIERFNNYARKNLIKFNCVLKPQQVHAGEFRTMVATIKPSAKLRIFAWGTLATVAGLTIAGIATLVKYVAYSKRK
jgi:hypothetical protein